MFYIDKDFRCHLDNPDGAYTAVESDVFDGKCRAYIEGFIYVPEGYEITVDGVVCKGVYISPWKPFSELETAQKLYEEMNASAIKEERIVALEEANAALQEENEMLTACVLEMSEIVYA